MPRAMVIHPKDNVAVALDDLAPGDLVQMEAGGRRLEVKAIQPIPFGHKIALQDVAKGAEVYKYGEVIGRASGDIKAGEHVHIHNLEGTRGRGDLAVARGDSPWRAAGKKS